VLVGTLGEGLLGGSLGDALVVSNDRRSDVKGGTLHEILLEILKTDFQVKLTTSGNDMLTSLGGLNLDHWVRLGELLQALNELGKISGVLHGHSHADNGGHGELHGLDATG